MNTVRFRFDDLCAIFSRYSSRLMIGMISTDDEAPEHVHQPHIIIRRNGVIDREYHNWDEINGDIRLELSPGGKPLSHYKPMASGDPRRPFSMLVDIEKDLHPGETLHINPKLCRARFYFNNGELYSTKPYTNVRYADLKTGQLSDFAPEETAIMAGLDVQIPDDGYAKLRFMNGTEEYIFQSGNDYEVEVTNRAPAITGFHAKYFYNIMDPKPERMWYPTGGQSLGLPAPSYTDFICMVGNLGLAIWEMVEW